MTVTMTGLRDWHKLTLHVRSIFKYWLLPLSMAPHFCFDIGLLIQRIPFFKPSQFIFSAHFSSSSPLCKKIALFEDFCSPTHSALFRKRKMCDSGLIRCLLTRSLSLFLSLLSLSQTHTLSQNIDTHSFSLSPKSAWA